MKAVHISLGKLGDIFSALPCVHQEYKRTGKPVDLIVSKQYASAVEGVDYIKPIIWNGHWQDLTGAIRFAKKQYQKVIVPQTYGKELPIQKRAPSFQGDSYLRSGMASEWDNLELVLPRPANTAELVKTHLGGHKTILLADKSESSAFPHEAELLKTLAYNFSQTHKVVKLSEIKLPNIKDFLALYDAADLIVTIDTVHLHLSAASKTPVVAFATDKPELWHGSAWKKRFTFYARYSEFESRKDEMVKAVERLLSGNGSIQIETLKTKDFRFGYNYAHIKHGDRIISAYRYHPKKDWKTKIAIGAEDSLLANLIVPTEIADNSLEDLRFFNFNGKLHASYVSAQAFGGMFQCVVGYGELVEENGQWKILKHIQPKYGRNNWDGLEKNWNFFSAQGKLFAIYGVISNDQVILELEGDKVVAVHKSTALKWNYGEIRGGCIIPWKGRLLRFFHSHDASEKREDWKYHVGCALMEPVAPFQTIVISKLPIVSGNEKWTPGCVHWKPKVIFPLGVVADSNGWKLSVGLNDCECGAVHLTEKDLNL